MTAPTVQPTLLIDGDIIAYQAAAVTDGRVYSIKSSDDSIEIPEIFKYMEEAKAYVKAAHPSLGELTIEQNFVPEEESHALHNVKESINSISEKYPGYELEVFVTGNTNFRNDFVSDYKANRSGNRTPFHLNTCKQYLLNRYHAKLEEGFEADDLIGCRATELRELGGYYVICTLDKDLDMIPGMHYNWRHNEEYGVGPSEAIKKFYLQCLTGDRTDNIEGLDGIGPVKAAKILDGAVTESELYLKTLDAWIEAHAYCHTIPEIEARLRTAANLLWILREPATLWSPPV